MRLEGRAKAGFYPTPREVVEGILKALTRYKQAFEGKHLLDPCAGEGEAAALLAEGLGMVPWGVELDERRAGLAAQRFLPLGGRVLQGDALACEAGGFALVWLNPPYDWDEEGERLEKAFVEAFAPAAVERGLLLLVVPEREVEGLWSGLRFVGSDAVAFRFPEGVRRYGEVVVGILRGGGIGPKELPLLPFHEGLRALEDLAWKAYPEGADPLLRLRKGEEGLKEACRTSPLWNRVEGGMGAEVGTFTPLLPLRKAHLALLLAGGVMDLQTLEIEGDPHAVLGRLRKEVVVLEEEDEGGHKRIEREVFRAGLVVLNMRTGEVRELS